MCMQYKNYTQSAHDQTVGKKQKDQDSDLQDQDQDQVFEFQDQDQDKDSDVQDRDQDQDFEKQVSRRLETKTQVSRTTTVLFDTSLIDCL